MKLEEGNFRGAVCLASSEDSFAELNTIAALKAKHPSPCEDSKFPPPPPVKRESDDILMIHEEDVAQAIHLFSKGSAGGPDGLRPHNVQDMISTRASLGRGLVLCALCVFMNRMLAGEIPLEVHPFFFGASLIALNKNDGGLLLGVPFVGW